VQVAAGRYGAVIRRRWLMTMSAIAGMDGCCHVGWCPAAVTDRLMGRCSFLGV
jgi:hypothetical protein